MGSLVPGAEGEGRLCTGYGALDTSWSAMEGEGVFTESRGLEPYYLDLLDRKYGKLYGTEKNDVMPVSAVPLGRQSFTGEALGNGAILGERDVVKTTYRPQPEALGMTPGRQPSSDLWRAEGGADMVGQVTGFVKQNPLFTVAIVGAAALVGYIICCRKR